MNQANRFLLLVFALLALALSLGCGGESSSSGSGDEGNDDDDAADDDDDNTTGDDDDDASPANISVTVQPVPEGNPYARRIVVTSEEPISITGKVTHPNEPGYSPSDPEATESGTTHTLWFYGLFPDATFDYEISLAEKSGASLATGKFDTPALPEWYLPGPNDVLNDTNTVDQSLWPALSINARTFTEHRGVIAVIDRTGRVRYLHETAPVEPSELIIGLNLLEDGDLAWTNRNNIFSTRANGDEQVLFDLQLNSPYYFEIHHYPFVYPGFPRQALTLFNYKDAGVDCVGDPAAEVVYDGVALVDENGLEQWRWGVSDDPTRFPPEMLNPCDCDNDFWGPGTYDFSHANSVTPYVDGQSIIVSARNLNRVVKVDLSTGEIEWVMGRDGNSDFTWIGTEPIMEQWFVTQHDAHFISEDRMLVFDNENHRYLDCAGRQWSRAMELQVDQDAKTVSLVWEYRIPFNHSYGNNQRLENGNTFISGGAAAVLVEIDADQQEIWHIEYPILTPSNITTGKLTPAWWVYPGS
jgi:Arylsulfotransferase (ASST)